MFARLYIQLTVLGLDVCLFVIKQNPLIRIFYIKNWYINFSKGEKKMATKCTRTYCKDHPSEEPYCYCVDCERLICFTCNNIEHKQHVSKDILKEAADRRAELQDTLRNDVDNKMRELHNEIDSMERKKIKLVENTKKNYSDIQNHARGIIRLVQDRYRKMVENLQIETRDKLDEYDRKLGLLNQQLESTRETKKRLRRL